MTLGPSFDKFCELRLGVYLLGPSYSRMDRMGQQIQRRLTSAFAGSQIPIPSDGVITTFLSAVQWDPKKIDSNVLVLIGKWICIRNDGTMSTQAADNTLMSVVDVGNTHQLNDVQRRFLDAGRLVYKYHHSTSISFIGAIIDPLRNLLPADGGPLSTELTAYGAVSGIISNSSYLGLVATAADNLRVSNFPRLVSIALLYHQINLETETEKRSFNDYNIDGVMSHLPTQADKKLVNDYAMVLPANKVTTTMSLLKTIRIESAEMIMAQRTPEERMEIISRLRSDLNPGPWITDYLEQERIAARSALRTQAADLLRAQLSHAVKAKTRRANLIADDTQRRRELQNIDDWTMPYDVCQILSTLKKLA